MGARYGPIKTLRTTVVAKRLVGPQALEKLQSYCSDSGSELTENCYLLFVTNRRKQLRRKVDTKPEISVLLQLLVHLC
jgi:hypothetical protein